MIDALAASGLLDEPEVAQFHRTGHFVYESGDHGDTWLALPLLFANAGRLQPAAARLAEKLRPHAPDVVCGPLIGGALVGQWVAHELNATFVYAEPRSTVETAGTRYAIPRAVRSTLRGKRAVVVDDVINAGWATLACVRAIEDQGGTVAVVAGLLVRTPGGLEPWANRGLAIEYLVGVRWNTWPAGDCPLCRSGIPGESAP